MTRTRENDLDELRTGLERVSKLSEDFAQAMAVVEACEGLWDTNHDITAFRTFSIANGLQKDRPTATFEIDEVRSRARHALTKADTAYTKAVIAMLNNLPELLPNEDVCGVAASLVDHSMTLNPYKAELSRYSDAVLFLGIGTYFAKHDFMSSAIINGTEHFAMHSKRLMDKTDQFKDPHIFRGREVGPYTEK